MDYPDNQKCGHMLEGFKLPTEYFKQDLHLVFALKL